MLFYNSSFDIVFILHKLFYMYLVDVKLTRKKLNSYFLIVNIISNHYKLKHTYNQHESFIKLTLKIILKNTLLLGVYKIGKIHYKLTHNHCIILIISNHISTTSYICDKLFHIMYNCSQIVVSEHSQIKLLSSRVVSNVVYS